ncbi:MAG: hypothetical protein OHK0015_46820 [Chloroflexi bacterium OHK40]
MQPSQRNGTNLFARHALRALSGALIGGVVGLALGILVMNGLFLLFGLTTERDAEFVSWWPVYLLAGTVIGATVGGGAGLCGGAAGALARAWLSRKAAVALGAGVGMLVVIALVAGDTSGGGGDPFEAVAIALAIGLAAAAGGAAGALAVRP